MYGNIAYEQLEQATIHNGGNSAGLTRSEAQLKP